MNRVETINVREEYESSRFSSLKKPYCRDVLKVLHRFHCMYVCSERSNRETYTERDEDLARTMVSISYWQKPLLDYGSVRCLHPIKHPTRDQSKHIGNTEFRYFSSNKECIRRDGQVGRVMFDIAT